MFAVMFVCLYFGLLRFFSNKIIRIKMLPNLPSFLKIYRFWTCPWRIRRDNIDSAHVTVASCIVTNSNGKVMHCTVYLSEWCTKKETNTQPLSSHVYLLGSYVTSTGILNCHKVFRPLHMRAFNIIKSICWQQGRASHESGEIKQTIN
jgi:ferredoxin-thioredoxin reductase catalytic subunit